ncbi:MAG: hypothetical protein QOH61_910 [Chloroflexota bacterium]|nr:hypothetical protein [Chloroflexota bacterium]
MTGSLIRRFVGGTSLATLTAVMIALGGGEVLAAHQVGSSGTTGSYSWTDTAAHPAGVCDYNGGGTAGHIYIVQIKVRAPDSVLWPAGTGSSSGRVGFKVKLQHLHGGTWSTVNTGPEASATASRHTSAMFGTRRVHWAGPISGKDRAVAVLTWYRPNDSVLGRAHVVIDHYKNNHDGIGRSYCPVGYSDV